MPSRRPPRPAPPNSTTTSIELPWRLILSPHRKERWRHAALPDTGERPAGLMLREFERCYTDRTVPEWRTGGTHRRRVIEERLVYATVFDL